MRGRARAPRRRRETGLPHALLIFLVASSASAETPERDCVAADAAASTEICIARASTIEARTARDADICAAIAHFSTREGLPPGFFARLIWRESLFEPNAVSPAGAQGVAQFMPGTARLRGLKNPFNPAEALDASAAYLAELRARYGNLGLAAAAYNAGEGAIDGVLAGRRGAPGETRAYVLAITGLDIEDWRDGKARPKLDYALSGDAAEQPPFLLQCKSLAATRRVAPMEAAAPSGDWKPWGAMIAAHRSKAVAGRMYRSAQRRVEALQAEAPTILRRRIPGRGPRALYAAMAGRDSRAEAAALCRKISQQGGACVVVKN